MKSIIETLSARGCFRTLLGTLDNSGVANELSGAGPFTLFAPDDTAFNRRNVDELGDRDKMALTLSYHIVARACLATEMANTDKLLTRSGKTLTVHMENGATVIDNAKCIEHDIECSNGVVHVIDNVFLPQLSGWYYPGL
ncbi:MAG TPA: fasciclin domain-containing protein [Anaeromyxobacteraceae bacterium]|nr:fasciclin domain-containing protein [Anaeromyxobacteraceae bacterium]